MKNSKKLIALVLAMVMIFALTASTLAATNATGVTVRVAIKGVINKPTPTNPDATETETICTAKAVTITTCLLYTSGEFWKRKRFGLAERFEKS